MKVCYLIFGILPWCTLSGQICIDVVDDIQRAANEIISPDRTVIVPRLNFACNGRITNIRVSVNGSTHNTGTNFPYVQVWRQSPPSQPYTLVERVQIQPSHLINQSANLEANISLTGNNRIQFLSGDVIGFYNPPDSGYTIEDVRTDGYVYYVFRGSNASSLNLATGFMSNRRQPLIQFTLDIQCNNLTMPSNGEIISCSSGSIGVGYEGDTCSFTCNTGYELTGSNTRTCQSNGSWSGSDDVCRRGGQICIDVVDGIQQDDNEVISPDRTVIVPRLTFTCNGRITNIRVRVETTFSVGLANGTDFPCIQVWRQSPTPELYNLVDRVQIQSSHLNTQLTYLEANILLAGNNRTQFLSGDVIGFYNPPNSGYVIGDIQTDGYMYYVFVGSNAESFDLTTASGMPNRRQPLIQFTLDIQCNNLTTPSNGEITSCSSGSIGVGYKGETCNFTCTTGYELTGSNTRTCQTNGSWSGSDDVCRRVPCTSLTDPNNGAINCSLRDDRVSSYEDTCSFTCNTGYELTGSSQRTCQSNGVWSGSPVSCTIMNCTLSSLPMNSMLAESCSSTYQSMCDLQCEEGFFGIGDPSYVCNMLSDGSVMWITSGGGWCCERNPTVIIVSNPAGTPVSGSTNTFDYPILSNVTLTCMVDPSPPAGATYQWNTGGCFTNNAHNTPTCFPTGQTTQNIIGYNLLAEDAGNITCTVTINGGSITSGTFTLRISGIAVTGASDISTDFVSSNQITDYSFVIQPFTLDSFNGIVRCASGLGPTGGNPSTEVGGWYFSGGQVPVRQDCTGPVFEVRGANGRNYPGVINLYLCGTFNTTEEGVYSCIMMNSSMMNETMRVGVYFRGRTTPMIDPPSSSTVTVVVGSSLTLSCTSRRSPPDTFTWRKDSGPIVQSTSITTVTHNSTSAVFRANYSINSVTTSDSGTYTCNVTNPIGSDSETISVNTTVPTPSVTVTAPNTQIVGRSLTLECSVTAVRGITSRVDIIWSRDGTEVERMERVSGSSTTGSSVVYTDTYPIMEVSTDDDGREYQCEVVINTSPLVMTTGSVTLNVTVPTPIVTVTAPNTQIVGQSLMLECSVTAVRGIEVEVDIVWSMNSIELKRMEGVSVSSTADNSVVYTDTYTISQLNTTDEGREYQCEVVINTSPLVMTNGGVVLNVMVPQPSVNISQSVNGSVSGLNHILTCKVTPVNGVQPSLVMISWTGGSSLSSSPRVNISDQTNDGVMYTRTVTFSPLLNGDDGQYNCSVSVAGFDEANNSSSVIVVVNAQCPILNAPANGTIACTITIIGFPSTGDTCTVRCNNSFVARDGDVTRSCSSNGNWSGTEPVCRPGPTVIIVTNPAGTLVSGSTNTFDYPILSNVTLTCNVTLSDGSTPMMTNYQWNTTGCFANNFHNTPTCFPTDQTTQSVTGNNLLAKDAGTITCTVTINDESFTSESLTLRISGIAMFTPYMFLARNQITDYSSVTQPFTFNDRMTFFRCATGLGPSGGDSSTDLGGWYLNGAQIPVDTDCGRSVFQVRATHDMLFPGGIDLFRCGTFTTTEEGVYSCIMINSSMMNQTMRVGVYFSGRTAPMIDLPSSSNVTAAVGEEFTLSCTSRGSPPDTFTWMKDSGPIVQSTSITTVTHNSTSAVFRANYSIHRVTGSHSGTYTCTVTNPIGNNTSSITVIVIGLPEVTVTPSSQSVEVTHTAMFTTTVSGVGMDNFTYQWRHDGTNITGKTGDTLMITNVMESDSGDYDCIVTNEYGDSDTSDVVVLMVTRVPPVITTHPMDTTVTLVNDTTSVSLTCEADGATSYNWERQIGSIPSGATGVNTNTLTIINLTPEDAGNYQCVATNASGSSESNYATLNIDVRSTSSSSGGGGGSAGAIVGAIIGVVVVAALIVVVVLIVMYRHRQKSSKQYEPERVPAQSLSSSSLAMKNKHSALLNSENDFLKPNTGDIPLETINKIQQNRLRQIPLNEFHSHVETMHEARDYGFEEEFRSISTDPQSSCDVGKLPVNRVKNRYANIYAYDFSRVRLQQCTDDETDYINACYIDGYLKGNAYIATQAPVPDTVKDFWQMVWDNKVPAIVMLTKLVEGGRPKCHQYWPEKVGEVSQPKSYLTVKLTATQYFADYELRKFELTNSTEQEGSPLEVKHFFFTSWPDHGVPQFASAVIRLIRKVRQTYMHSKTSPPLLVHCSAGVGRTGTYIVLDIMLQQMPEANTVNVYECVRNMRAKRLFMVQTLPQYIFIHDALDELILCGDTSFDVQNLRVKINRMSKIIPGININAFQEQFETLKLFSRAVTDTVCEDALKEVNRSKNRFKDMIPFNDRRVQLRTTAAPGSDYINASFIDGYKERSAFIATQCPLEDTTTDFWKMIWEYRSSAIVMVCSKEHDQGNFFKYWPDKDEEYSKIKVEFKSEEEKDNLIIRKFGVNSLRAVSALKPLQVTMLHYTGWPVDGKASNTKALLELIKELLSVQQNTGNRAITVMCDNGCGRTGTFITIYSTLERIKTDGSVDIFQTVKSARLERSNLVANSEQYVYCHEAVAEFLEGFDKYANFK